MKKKLTLSVDEIAISFAKRHKINISELVESVIFYKMATEVFSE